jgi:hypothetical protein
MEGPNSLITAQVASGLVVRMAILYEVLTGDRPRPVRGVPSPESEPESAGDGAPSPVGEPA